jgi:DnaJ-class molecular chaperone
VSDRDLYRLLGVRRFATMEEIRASYRRLARELHPDVNPDDQTGEARFKQVTAAYRILSRSERRALYDEFGLQAFAPGFDADAQRHRSAGGSVSPRPRSTSVHGVIELSFVQAARGGELELAIPSWGGRLRVRIPPATADGQLVRVPGRWSLRRWAKTELVLRARVAPHPLVRRRGLDLHVRVAVPLDEAFCGAKIRVPTPLGRVRVNVPPGSETGTRLRVAGKGLRRGTRSGDLFILLQVVLPDDPPPARPQQLR